MRGEFSFLVPVCSGRVPPAQIALPEPGPFQRGSVYGARILQCSRLLRHPLHAECTGLSHPVSTVHCGQHYLGTTGLPFKPLRGFPGTSHVQLLLCARGHAFIRGPSCHPGVTAVPTPGGSGLLWVGRGWSSHAFCLGFLLVPAL